MADIMEELSKLLNNGVLNEETKTAITEAYNNKLLEAREQIAAELRDEFSQKFERDKNSIVEAMDAKINEALEENLKDLNEQKKAAVAAQVSYKKAVKEHTEKFSTFAKGVLESELAEFSDDRRAVLTKLKAFETFVSETLQKELEEFQEDKRTLAEERVAMKLNSKKELEETKQAFIKEYAAKATKFVNKVLVQEMNQLKDEIKEAQKKNFGMKIFESFAAEFSSSFYNANAETNKFAAALKEREAKLDEERKIAKNLEVKLEESNKNLRVANDQLVRVQKLNEMVSPLAGEKRSIMLELLETVPTSRLHESFNKYLPHVLEDGKSAMKAKVLNENAVMTSKTGDRTNLVSENNEENKKVVNEFVDRFKKIASHPTSKVI